MTNASGNHMSVEGETQLFLSAPGGAVKRVRVFISKSLGKDFLIGWQDQVRLSILHEDWPNFPHAARAVCTNEEEREWPAVWPQEIQDALDDYADVFADKLTPDRTRREPMPMPMQPDAIPYQVSVARPIPYHWIDAAKKVVQEAVEAGIVSSVKEAVE